MFLPVFTKQSSWLNWIETNRINASTNSSFFPSRLLIPTQNHVKFAIDAIPNPANVSIVSENTWTIPRGEYNRIFARRFVTDPSCRYFLRPISLVLRIKKKKGGGREKGKKERCVQDVQSRTGSTGWIHEINADLGNKYVVVMARTFRAFEYLEASRQRCFLRFDKTEKVESGVFER